MTLNYALWLPIVSLVLGIVCHALSSSERTAEVLAKVGIKKQLPREWLPGLALFFGLASGVVDNVVGGQDWQHAVGAAVIATVSATFGTTASRVAVDKTTGGGPPTPPPAVMVLFAFLLTIGVSGCGLLREGELPRIAVETADCIISKLNLPDEQIALLCGVQEAERIIMRDLLANARTVAAEEAHQAVSRARAERCDGGAQ